MESALDRAQDRGPSRDSAGRESQGIALQYPQRQGRSNACDGHCRYLLATADFCYVRPVIMVAPEQRVFFVVGRGRSGTTLLSRMLRCHPALEVAPEGFFVMNLRRRYGQGPWSEARIEAFCSDLVLENRMASWGLELPDVRQRLRRALPALTFEAACAEVYFSYAQRTAKRLQVSLVGDKNPHYGLFTQELCTRFPAARFVHIVRDPRDNVLSYQQVPFDLSNTAALAYRWRRYNRELVRVAARHPGRFLRLRFEDLLQEPAANLTTICEFLGVRFDPAMLSFFEQQPKGFYGEGSAWFEHLQRPIDESQARKWEGAMDAHAREVIEHICADLMVAFGYDGARPRARLSARDRAGAALGWGSVTAEQLIFGRVPAEWRIRFINAYRARSGRI